MKTFALIGKPLSHSISQEYYTNKFLQQKINDAEYQLFPLKNIDEIKTLLQHPTLQGFNVTIPYKSAIIPFLDEIDTISQVVGAVNCVVKQNGKWVGYNTDVLGVEETIPNMEGSVLILGSGGAAKAVDYVLKQRGISFQIVSRKKDKETITYNEVTEELIRQTTCIINTTPLGMFPHVDEMPPIPYSALHSKHILIDLIYNPEETMFLKEGKKRGAVIINGLTMFETQAEANWKLFNL